MRNLAAVIKLEVDILLRLRTPVTNLAEIVKCSLKSGFHKRLQAAEQITPTESTPAPRVMKERLVHVKPSVIAHYAVEQLSAVHRRRLHDRRNKVVLFKIEDLDLVAKLAKERGEGPWRVHGPVGEVWIPVTCKAIGFLQRFSCLVIKPDDELRFRKDIRLPKQTDRLFVFLDLGLLVEEIKFHLGSSLRTKGNVHEPRLAPETQHILVTLDICDARIDSPFDAIRQTAPYQLFTELRELLAIDGWLLVSENEETDIMIIDEVLDFIDDFFGSRTR